MCSFTTNALLFLKISLVSLTLAPGLATHGCLRPCRPDRWFSNNYLCPPKDGLCRRKRPIFRLILVKINTLSAWLISKNAYLLKNAAYLWLQTDRRRRGGKNTFFPAASGFCGRVSAQSVPASCLPVTGKRAF